MANFRVCIIDNCGKKHLSGGFCAEHYHKNRVFGDPNAKTKSEKIWEFIEKATKCKDTECLFWPFPRKEGPKKQRVRLNVDGVISLAHRHVCKLAHGEPSTSDLEAAHSCGNGHLDCMNASHLRWATSQENSDDKTLHGTKPIGGKVNTAKLTEDDVRKIKIMLKDGVRSSTIASMFFVSWYCIDDIRHQKSWKHIESSDGDINISHQDSEPSYGCAGHTQPDTKSRES